MRRDLWPVFAAMAVGFALRLAYVLATQNHRLPADPHEYDSEARFIVAGKWFWTTLPYGIPHAGAWKAPLYPAWTGVIYRLLGSDPDNVRIVQTFIGPLVVFLTFMLGRRLFGYRAGVAAAFVVALYPFAWQYETLLYPEALATPLTLVILLLLLERKRVPSVRGAALVGALLGVSVLVRPSAFFLFGLALAAWWIASGWRRALGLTFVAGLVCLLVITPWTARNRRVVGPGVSISIQDAAAYGTFNDEAAHDKVYPWAWRQHTRAVEPIINARPPLSDAEFHRQLRALARSYIHQHPWSVPKAFFWNGLSRLWDVRRPNRALIEVPFEGRTRWLTWVGLIAYYGLLPLALFGLYRERRRRALVIPILVMALGASVVFTIDSGTRYRAPLEPLIVVLACGAAAGLVDQRRRTPPTTASTA